MTPVLARIKRAVRAGISLCGGIDGAGATADRSRSVAGDWNNLSHPAFPPLDCAYAIDEAALAQGRQPAILTRYAAELGHIALPLTVSEPDAGDLHAMLAVHCRRSGELSGELCDALADKRVNAAEAGAVLAVAECQARHLAGMIAALRTIADGGA